MRTCPVWLAQEGRPALSPVVKPSEPELTRWLGSAALT